LALKTLVVFYLPFLLFDLAMAPFFAASLILPAFLGLQFLAWGYVHLAASPLPQPLSE
jgi:hypothetical protein